jgi:hypothetical protein
MKTLSDIRREINKRLGRRMKELRQEYAQDFAKAEVTALVAQELAPLGIEFHYLNSVDSGNVIWWTSPEAQIRDPKLFHQIHQVVGPLVRTHDIPIGKRGNRVLRTLQPRDDRFAHLQFKVETRLPKGAKCRIVTTKARSYRSVVCG